MLNFLSHFSIVTQSGNPIYSILSSLGLVFSVKLNVPGTLLQTYQMYVSEMTESVKTMMRVSAQFQLSRNHWIDCHLLDFI